MKKNDIIKVSVRRQIITPETKENYWSVSSIPTEVKTLDVVVDSVGKSIIKGHYLNESDRRYKQAYEHWDMDGIQGVIEYSVVSVEIDNEGHVFEYKIFADNEAAYYHQERMKEEAKKLHLKKKSDEWWQFMKANRYYPEGAILTIPTPTVFSWTGRKQSDGQLVG